MAKAEKGKAEGVTQRLEKAVEQLETAATRAQKKTEALKAEKETLEDGIASLRADYEMLERKINDLAKQKETMTGQSVDPSVKADITNHLDRVIGRLETMVEA